MQAFTESSLSDSTIFQQLNKSAVLLKNIAYAVKNGAELDKSYIEEQYAQAIKTRISPIAGKVLQAYDERKIRLIYTKAVHISIAIPFIVLDIGGQPTACIFIGEFSPITKDGTALTIEMKRLYTLMESAYIAIHYFTRPEKFIRNAAFVKLHAEIYSAMTMRILNKEYALSLEKDIYDGLNFISAYFFLERILGITNPEICKAYATSCCNNPSQLQLDIMLDGYTNANVTNINELVLFFSKQAPKMEPLTFRYFFERWISSFGTGACMSIDCFPYLYFVITNVILGSFLINVAGLSEIVKNAKSINSFYAEVSRIV